MVIIKAQAGYVTSVDENNQRYVLYPYTLLQCITNEQGDNLENTLRNFVAINFDDAFATTTHTHDIDLDEIDEAFGLIYRYLSAKNIRLIDTNNNITQHTITYNNEIHIINDTCHYKYDGNSWNTITIELPFSFINGYAFVFNDEIHVFNECNHYKYDGNSWTLVSELPFDKGHIVIFNNELHVLIGGNHYKYDHNSWELFSNLPFSFINGYAFVFNDEIHVFNECNHYKYDGNSWTLVSELPFKSNLNEVIL